MPPIRLERYRTQWSHVPLAVIPFLGAVSVVLVVTACERYLQGVVATAIVTVAGVGFAACVLSTPWLWRWWRAAGSRELCDDGAWLAVVEPGTARVLTRCAVSPANVTAAEFHYTVTSRFAGGTFRAPAVVLRCEDGTLVSIGVPGSTRTWAGRVARLRRPNYQVTPEAWAALSQRLGVAAQQVAVVDARVG